ncbi:enoyl-CoA hydratase/isomerase family protein [Salipiger abyssi]|uniref:enoyl-CoA hydratase/isomerase family protein n=1 Tax=Salipiger abyssi TaxID=1250539 RepID=UPI001A9022ED|nr:enoyl-CoA hydratase-related protein [Salipiger abyssi]MBN9887167.1 enoyl-CoA hydratase/isomerase family protein [Salipiger abyssi]
MTDVATRIEAGVGWLSLNRPDAANAISGGLARDLFAALQDLTARDDVRCIVLRAEGRLFCGGGDLADFAAEGPETMPERILGVADTLHRSIVLIDRMEKPLITAIQGTAAGAGVVLAALGDIVLASEQARFVPAYDRLELTPDGGSSWVLPRVMGERAAMAFLLLGAPMSAQEAVASGLVTRTVPHAALAGETARIAETLARGSGWAAGQTRRLIRAGRDAPLPDHLDHEGASVSQAIARPEARAAIAAFLDKVRDPAPRSGGIGHENSSQ